MIGLGYLSGLLYGIIVLLLALGLYKLGIPKKYTRKIVHILVGFEWIFLYSFMGAGIHFLIVCLAFLALLSVSYFARLMPMISSDEDNAPGTVYYAVAMTGVAIVGCFVPEVMLPFGIGIFCTSIGDGAAGLIGQLVTKPNPKIYKKKTLLGALANLVCSFVSALLMSIVFEMGLGIPQCIAIALLSTSLELVVGKGLDNIAVTWAVTALAYAFMYYPGINNYLVPILLTPFIIIFATSANSLTTSGVIAALAVDLAISVPLGNFGFTLLLSFFAIGVLLDKVAKRAKNQPDVEAKGSKRDHMQVLANALVPSLLALAYLFSGERILVVAFVASFAEALADTASSSLGSFAKGAFDPFRMKKCTKGMSGGMSVIGTASALCGSVVISVIALLFGVIDLPMTLIAAASGFVGSLFDSLLGSLVQVKYTCPKCKKETERRLHCGVRTERSGGLLLIDNDVVNLLSSLISAAISITVCAIAL